MSGPIAFRFTDDDLREEFDEYRENNPDDPKQSEAARELIDVGLAARHRDVYDNIDADEELRERVEELRNIEETDSEAIRRLLRGGAGAESPRNRTWGDRVAAVVSIVLIGGTMAAGFGYAGTAGGVVAIVVWALVFAFIEKIYTLTEQLFASVRPREP